eukprot:scaffold22406_cov58-Phaeocystis_antarctica.AAC.1
MLANPTACDGCQSRHPAAAATASHSHPATSPTPSAFTPSAARGEKVPRLIRTAYKCSESPVIRSACE